MARRCRAKELTLFTGYYNVTSNMNEAIKYYISGEGIYSVDRGQKGINQKGPSSVVFVRRPLLSADCHPFRPLSAAVSARALLLREFVVVVFSSSLTLSPPNRCSPYFSPPQIQTR